MKTTHLKDSAGRNVIDILLSGTMTVLPPSIHPETGFPYHYVGQPLLDADFGTLPELNDSNLHILRTVVESEEAPTLISGKTTHDAGLRLSAKLVQAGASDELISDIIAALVPEDYRGDSLKKVPEWCRSARQKKFDKPSAAGVTSGKKRAASDVAVGLFRESGAELFHDDMKRAYMTVPAADGGLKHIGVKTTEGELWLTNLYFVAEGRALGKNALESANSTLEAQARFAAPQFKTFQRVGAADAAIVVDLGRDDGKLVSVTSAGWNLTSSSDLKMTRSPGFGELPIPERREGALDQLRSLLNLNDDTWPLCLAFLIGSLRPHGPYMCLLVEGEQGSGKSFLATVIKRIIDPHAVERSRLPDKDRDLMIHAQDFYLLVFDNVSGIKGDISDLLCMLATGGGMGVRTLYANNELFVFNFARPLVINGIADFVQRPDLLERAIPLKLPAMAAQNRRTEEEMYKAFAEVRPGVLGALYDIAATGLRNLPNTSSKGVLRMADCERWLNAAEPATGMPTGSLVKAIKAAQDEVSIDRVHNDGMIMRLARSLRNGPFEGTVLTLFQRLTTSEDLYDQMAPKTASHFSRYLTRMKPVMSKAGIHVAMLNRTNEGKIIRCWLDGQEGLPPADFSRPSF